MILNGCWRYQLARSSTICAALDRAEQLTKERSPSWVELASGTRLLVNWTAVTTVEFRYAVARPTAVRLGAEPADLLPRRWA